MLGLEIVVAVVASVLVGSVAALRLRIAAPIVLLLGGLLLSLVPQLNGVGLPPEVVLLVFLPPLLFWESLTPSLREMRTFRLGILLSGTLLVAFTAALVAVVAHAMGLSWSTAWIVGAAVAPSDATAVAALRQLLPHRSQTQLKAESLINDGMALVIYTLALAYAASGEAPTPLGTAWSLVVSFGGGILVAVLVGWGSGRLLGRIRDEVHNNVMLILTPFIAYLLAELVHASGVVAVVGTGLYLAQIGPRVIPANIRALATPFWTLAIFLLNGSLFVLVGIQIPVAMESLSSTGLRNALLATTAVYLAVILGRWLFLEASSRAIHLLDRRPDRGALRSTPRARVVQSVAGFRGAVSLAMALSVPASTSSPAAPARDMVVFVTGGVVLASLVLQALALPKVVRWARLPDDDRPERETVLAQETATQEALDALPALADQQGTCREVVDQVRTELETTLAAHNPEDADDEDVRRHEQYVELRTAVLERKREALVRLRDEGTIDDNVLRPVQARLDLEELRLQHPVETE